MKKHISYFEAVYQTLDDNKNGLTNKQIYENVDALIKTKGKWWQKTV